MKNWLIISLLCLTFAQAQLPQGRLYLHTYAPVGQSRGELGYIDYPTGAYQPFDSLDVAEMCYAQGRLYVSEAYRFDGSTDIRLYHTQTLELIDSLPDVSPNQLAFWKNKLVFSSYTQPGFRVYDLDADSLLFALDSAKVPDALDVLVVGDSAYVSAGHTVTVIDLNLQDTVATIELPAVFPFLGYAVWLAEAKGDIYISMEYATGAPRYSLYRLQLPSLVPDSLRFVEFYSNSYPFVVAEDKLYLAWFESHYDLAADSLYLDPMQEKISLAYDAEEQVLMVHHFAGKTVETWFQDSLTGTIGVPQTIDLALFVPESGSTSIRESPSAAPFRLFPNPAQEELFLQFSVPGAHTVRIIDAWGRECWHHPAAGQFLSELRIPLLPLSPGPYWVEVSAAGQRHSVLFIRQPN